LRSALSILCNVGTRSFARRAYQAVRRPMPSRGAGKAFADGARPAESWVQGPSSFRDLWSRVNDERACPIVSRGNVGQKSTTTTRETRQHNRGSCRTGCGGHHDDVHRVHHGNPSGQPWQHERACHLSARGRDAPDSRFSGTIISVRAIRGVIHSGANSRTVGRTTVSRGAESAARSHTDGGVQRNRCQRCLSAYAGLHRCR